MKKLSTLLLFTALSLAAGAQTSTYVVDGANTPINFGNNASEKSGDVSYNGTKLELPYGVTAWTVKEGYAVVPFTGKPGILKYKAAVGSNLQTRKYYIYGATQSGEWTLLKESGEGTFQVLMPKNYSRIKIHMYKKGNALNCRVENVFITKPLILTSPSTVLPMPVIDGDYADLCTLQYSGLSADLQVTTTDGNLSLDGTDGTIVGSSVSSSLGFGNGFALVGSASSQSSILERTATVRAKLAGIPATYITDGDEFDDSQMPTLTYSGNIYFADPSVNDCYETLATFQYQPRMPKEAANWAGLLAHKTRVVLNYPDATYATNGALKLALDGNMRIHTLRVPNMQNVNFDTLDLDINPNCIIYAGAGCSGKNVVVDGTAATFLLTDFKMSTNEAEARNYPFVVEEAFTATLACYTRKCYVDGGYETIILPFAPTRVYYLTESKDYKGYKLQQFSQNASDEVVFSDATWQANTPFMIRPTASGTRNQQQEFRFIGENVLVEAVGANDVFGTDFVGGYNLSDATGQYFLNSTGKYFVQSNKTQAWNTPFRCYLKSDSGLAQMRVRVEQPTGIRAAQGDAMAVRGAEGAVACEATEAVVLRVTDLSGRLVREVRTEAGRTSLTGFLPGFYLVNGQKVIVR